MIVCPYHDWTYDLEGKLRVIPDRRRAFAGVDLDGLDLKPAAFARWRGMLWVHPSADDAPVADWFAAIEPHLGQHRVDRLPEEPDARSERVIAANWKIDAAALSRYIHNHSQSHKSLKSQFRQSTHPHSKKIPPTDNERPPSILKILINPANPDSDNPRPTQISAHPPQSPKSQFRQSTLPPQQKDPPNRQRTPAFHPENPYQSCKS